MDRVGRRPLLLIGVRLMVPVVEQDAYLRELTLSQVGGCCISLILEAAMSAAFAETNSGNTAGLQAGVAFAYLFLAFYSVGIDVAGVVFYSELFPNHVRTKGIALSIATISLTDLVYLQVAQLAFSTIGWKYWLVFIIITFLGFIWAWKFLPETKGIPLEEMSALFGDDNDVAVYSRDIHFQPGTHEMERAEVGEDKAVSQHRETGVETSNGHVDSKTANGTVGR